MVAKAALPPPPAWHTDLDTVGVTGTNGKTTTTTYVAAALASLSQPVARVTTLGCFVGDERLPSEGGYRTFLRALALARERGGRHAAIELTSEALALGFIHAWPCRVGVFTNLSRDHLDRHSSAEHYLASKAQLFMHLPETGAAVLNGCDPASELLSEVIPAGVRTLYYGVASRGAAIAELDLQTTAIRVAWSGTELELKCSSGLASMPATLRIRSIGEIFAENALAALAGALAAGVPASAAAAAIAAAAPPPGRFEVVRERPYVVVDYAHTPDALARTLATGRRLCSARLTVVFGAGGERDQAKRPLMGEAAREADRVLLTNDNPRSEDPGQIAADIRAGLTGHLGVELLLDRAQAIRRAIRDAAADDVVIIAGKGHETEQRIGQVAHHFSDREIALEA